MGITTTVWVAVLALVGTGGPASAVPGGDASAVPAAPIAPQSVARAAPVFPVVAEGPLADARQQPLEGPAMIRGRATGAGAIVGAGLAGGVALVIGSLVCLMPSDQTGRACSLDQWVGVVGGFTLGATLAGGLVGGAVGAAWPVLRPPGAATRFWDRASGDIGAASLHVGAGSARGLAAERGLFPAFRGSVLVKLGPYLALGPETGRYTLRTLERYPDRNGVLQASVRASAVYFLAMAVRLGLPLGPLYPYALASAGYYLDYGNGGGASLGAGAEWRLRPSLALAAEARVQRGSGDPRPPPLVTATAGLSLSW
jgi:hypothetical protein